MMAARGREEQEKGHKWEETLSSVEVLKVNRVSVKLTPMFPSPLSSSQTAGLCNRVFTAPSVSSFLSSMKDFRAVIPTCRRADGAVYLFEHISCILYIVTFLRVPHMRSSYRVPIGPCPSMTVVFDVWHAVRLWSQPSDSGWCPIQDITGMTC